MKMRCKNQHETLVLPGPMYRNGKYYYYCLCGEELKSMMEFEEPNGVCMTTFKVKLTEIRNLLQEKKDG